MCGKGEVVTFEKSYNTTKKTLELLEHLQERGGLEADRQTSHGIGVSFDHPLKFYREVLGNKGINFEQDEFAVGSFTLPKAPEARAKALKIIKETLCERLNITEQDLIERVPPTDNSDLSNLAKFYEPDYLQVFFNRPAGIDAKVFEDKLMECFIELTVKGVAANNDGDLRDFGVCSLSTKMLTMKGIARPDQVIQYFQDFQNPAFETSTGRCQHRKKTNSPVAAPNSHPYYAVSHNGEVNSIEAIRKILEMILKEIHGVDIKIPETFSDTRIVDMWLVLRASQGQDMLAEVTKLFRPAWWSDKKITGEVREAFSYWDKTMPPAVGPAFITVHDAKNDRYIFINDHSGDRDSIFEIYKDSSTGKITIVAASEGGTIPSIRRTLVSRIPQLEAGEVMTVCCKTGEIKRGLPLLEEIVAEQARHQGKSFTELNAEHTIKLNSKPEYAALEEGNFSVHDQMRALGIDGSLLDHIVLPALNAGKDTVGAMNPVKANPATSLIPYTVIEHAKNDAAQVTNRAGDPNNEPHLFTTISYSGPNPLKKPEANIVENTGVMIPGSLAQMYKHPKLQGKIATLDATFDPRLGEEGIRASLEDLKRQALEAVRGGAEHIVVTDRFVDTFKAAHDLNIIGGLINAHLKKNNARLDTGLIKDSGDDMHPFHSYFAISCGYDMVNPRMLYELAHQRGGQSALESAYKYMDGGLKAELAKPGLYQTRAAVAAGKFYFDSIDMTDPVLQEAFPGALSPGGGNGFSTLYENRLAFHFAAVANKNPEALNEIRGLLSEHADPYSFWPTVKTLTQTVLALTYESAKNMGLPATEFNLMHTGTDASKVGGEDRYWNKHIGEYHRAATKSDDDDKALSARLLDLLSSHRDASNDEAFVAKIDMPESRAKHQYKDYAAYFLQNPIYLLSIDQRNIRLRECMALLRKGQGDEEALKKEIKTLRFIRSPNLTPQERLLVDALRNFVHKSITITEADRTKFLEKVPDYQKVIANYLIDHPKELWCLDARYKKTIPKDELYNGNGVYSEAFINLHEVPPHLRQIEIADRKHRTEERPMRHEDALILSSSRPPLTYAQLGTTTAKYLMKNHSTAHMSEGAITPQAHRELALIAKTISTSHGLGEGGLSRQRKVGGLEPDAGSNSVQIASGKHGMDVSSILAFTETENLRPITDEELEEIKAGLSESTKQLMEENDATLVMGHDGRPKLVICIKGSQGAKDGEGGQLPGDKVTGSVAQNRGGMIGGELVSPPTQATFFSIENIKKTVTALNFDLRKIIKKGGKYELTNPDKGIVIEYKIVANPRLTGSVAVALAESGVTNIVIGDGTGGTAAAKKGSIRHTGGNALLGCLEAHKALLQMGRRDDVRLIISGGTMNRTDGVIGHAFGADAIDIGKRTLERASGCVAAALCSTDCPKKITTDGENFDESRRRGEREEIFFVRSMLDCVADLGYENVAWGEKNSICGMAHEVLKLRSRQELRAMGVRANFEGSLDKLISTPAQRNPLYERTPGVSVYTPPTKPDSIVIEQLPALAQYLDTEWQKERPHVELESPDGRKFSYPIKAGKTSIPQDRKIIMNLPVNTNHTAPGNNIAGTVNINFGNPALGGPDHHRSYKLGKPPLPEASVIVSYDGIPGHLSAAFAPAGVVQHLEFANDFAGMCNSGGVCVITPRNDMPLDYKPEDNLIAANGIGHGASRGFIIVNGAIGRRCFQRAQANLHWFVNGNMQMAGGQFETGGSGVWTPTDIEACGNSLFHNFTTPGFIAVHDPHHKLRNGQVDCHSPIITLDDLNSKQTTRPFAKAYLAATDILFSEATRYINMVTPDRPPERIIALHEELRQQPDNFVFVVSKAVGRVLKEGKVEDICAMRKAIADSRRGTGPKDVGTAAFAEATLEMLRANQVSMAVS